MHHAGHLTALGWTTFALYLVAAMLSFRAAMVSRSQNSAAICRVWIWLGVILTALGLNKEIDLQTLVIELGRQLAGREHLYEYRLRFHAIFFLGFVLLLIALFATILFRSPARIGKLGRQLPLATGGCVLICTYIVLRAASIDHMDQILGFDLEQIPYLWLLEAGGLLLIIVQALFKPHPTV